MQARFTRALDKLEIAGTYVGMPTVRHIRGILWEVRVRDQTGSYRLFFGVASGRNVIGVACGEVKKSNSFPKRVYDWAEREVATYLKELEE